MMRSTFRVIFASILSISAIPALTASPIGFAQTNLASNQTDANLVNPWAIAASATSPFWLGANGSGTSVLYNGAGVKQGLTVTIPGDGSVTGVVFSNIAGNFNGNTFLFASEDGTVSGWRGALGVTAETLQLGSPANVYTGLADANINGNGYAYAANFRAGTIDVLKGNGGAPNPAGNFTDPNLPAGYAPFNVTKIGGSLYVTYALQDGSKKDDVSGAGHGFVDKYDLNGNFVARLITGGLLNSPWGLALAPAGFGDVGGALLVGNFGDGHINAYNPVTGAFIETLTDANGNPLAIDGLWGLSFGNGSGSGPAGTLYFTAGPGDESQGLFGRLEAVPEPGTWLLSGFSLLALALYRTRRSFAFIRG
jgi:uncharacterized protein (TIGR03118 family)